jgi:4-hydroxyphenylacetate 3-monooxygenase
MGARSGNNYLSSLRRLRADLWLARERVADPSIHPAFVKRARMLASLYDLQMEHPAAMTWRLDDGDRVGLSFIQPRSIEDVCRRGAMFRRWASSHGGALDWTPDYCNTTLAALSAAKTAFADVDSRYGENLDAYYTEARQRDWCIEPGPPMPADGLSEIRIVNSDAEGLLIEGSQAVGSLGPFAEELLIMAPGLIFAIACNARGLRLSCAGESDCTVAFDHVLVPSQRIFFCGNIAAGVAALEQSSVAVNQMHQRAVLAAVTAESRSGDAELIRKLVEEGELGAQPDKFGQFIPARAALEGALEIATLLWKRP